MNSLSLARQLLLKKEVLDPADRRRLLSLIEDAIEASISEPRSRGRPESFGLWQTAQVAHDLIVNYGVRPKAAVRSALESPGKSFKIPQNDSGYERVYRAYAKIRRGHQSGAFDEFESNLAERAESLLSRPATRQ